MKKSQSRQSVSLISPYERLCDTEGRHDTRKVTDEWTEEIMQTRSLPIGPTACRIER